MIPFQKDFDFTYGQSSSISPLVRRVVARNPGRFTYTGTGTFIVGHGQVAIIDPGPDHPEHFSALKAALRGETVSHVFVTHHHMDHSPLARPLADHFGAILFGRSGAVTAEDGGAVRQEAGDDRFFKPDVEINDAWIARGDDWTLKALHTPGHTAEHFCFALLEENALFCGDHIMGWSTSIVSPPDGRMGDYIASLRRIRSLQFSRLLPAHGPLLDAPDQFIEAYIEHRLERERQVLREVERGKTSVREIVDALYANLDRSLQAAAMHSVWAHLIHLVDNRVLIAAPDAALDAKYRPI